MMRAPRQSRPRCAWSNRLTRASPAVPHSRARRRGNLMRLFAMGLVSNPDSADNPVFAADRTWIFWGPRSNRSNRLADEAILNEQGLCPDRGLRGRTPGLAPRAECAGFSPRIGKPGGDRRVGGRADQGAASAIASPLFAASDK